jgi:DNA end-binding protein Ku
VKDIDKKVRLAQQLIESWSDAKFDFTNYEDKYRGEVQAIIDAKVAGREVVVPEVEEEPAVINLMDALRKSVQRGPEQKALASKNKSVRRHGAASANGRHKAHTGKRRHAS